MAANVVNAIIARLLASSAVTALTGTRISGQRQDAWAMPTYAVVVNGPQGGAGEIGSGLVSERIDVIAYGSTGLNAKTLSQVVFDALIPPDERGVGFTLADTRVHSLRAEAGRIYLVDPDTRWSYVVMPIIATYGRAAAA